jgi:phosphate transport system protein
MKSNFTEQLEKLDKRVIEMGSLVERQVTRAVTALIERNEAMANEVMKEDERVDELELSIDEEVLEILARHQPVAVDLRDVIGISKINGDLERIGDHAQNIAESARTIMRTQREAALGVVPKMADIVRTMLRDSIDSFIHKDTDLALAVCKRDEEIDRLNKHLFADILAGMIKDPNTIPISLDIIRVSKNLERIADHCTNICEDVVFICNAKFIKHGHEPDLKVP